MVFPPIHWFQGLGGKRRLSDIEFLAKKEFDGKLVENESTRTTTGVLVTLTAGAGKDMYLARVHINAFSNRNATAVCIVELQVNGVVKDTWDGVWESPIASGNEVTESYEFLIGFKVIATQIIKLQVTSISTNTTINGSIQCFEETTGETPVI